MRTTRTSVIAVTLAFLTAGAAGVLVGPSAGAEQTDDPSGTTIVAEAVVEDAQGDAMQPYTDVTEARFFLTDAWVGVEMRLDELHPPLSYQTWEYRLHVDGREFAIGWTIQGPGVEQDVWHDGRIDQRNATSERDEAGQTITIEVRRGWLETLGVAAPYRLAASTATAAGSTYEDRVPDATVDGSRVLSLEQVGPTIVLPEQPDATPANARPHVIVGVPDTGINPYHEAFHRPGLTEHPCTYIPGFPCDVEALELTLDADSFEDALVADADVWASVEQGEWYWIPETPFVAVTCTDAGALLGSSDACILDVNSTHGTGTTSSVLSENPDALIAFKQGLSTVVPFVERGIPVDVYSVSWGNVVPVPGHPDVLCANYEAAPLMVLAAGNDPRPSLADCQIGEPSLLTVGGAYAVDESEELLAAKQAEYVSYYCRPVAQAEAASGLRRACGTSFAAPTVAGGISKVILELREASGYTGSLTGGYVDPILGVTIEDLRGAVNRTASYDPEPRYGDAGILGAGATSVPVNPAAPWLQWGWGFYDGWVANATTEHLLGTDPADKKPSEARMHMQTQFAAKQAVYG